MPTWLTIGFPAGDPSRLSDAATQLGNAAKEMSGVGSSIGSVVSGVTSSWEGSAVTAFGGTSEKVLGHLGNIASGHSAASSALVTYASTLADAQTQVRVQQGKIDDAIEGYASDGRSVAMSLADRLGSGVFGAIDSVAGDVASRLGAWSPPPDFVTVLKESVTPLQVPTTESILHDLASGVGRGLSSVVSGIEGAVRYVDGGITSAITGVENEFANAVSAAHRVVDDLFDSVSDAAKEVVRQLEGVADDLTRTIEAAFGASLRGELTAMGFALLGFERVVSEFDSAWNPNKKFKVTHQKVGLDSLSRITGPGGATGLVSMPGLKGLKSEPFGDGEWTPETYMLQTYVMEGITGETDAKKSVSVSVVETSAGPPARYVVEIPGVQPMLPGDHTGVDNLENADWGMYGDTDYSHTVENIIAGLPKGSDVMLVGHSQGGIVAMDVATRMNSQAVKSNVHVTNVLTFGSPITYMNNPGQQTQVLQMTNSLDVVPKLDVLGEGTGNSADHSSNWSTVTFTDRGPDPGLNPGSDVGSFHNPVTYAAHYPTQSSDPSVQAFNQSASQYDCTSGPGSQPSVTVFNIATT